MNDELEGLHAQAGRLGAIMGLVAGVAVAAPTARWRIADTLAAEFGRQVATDLVFKPSHGCSTRLRWNGSQRRATALALLRACRTPSSVLRKHAVAGRDLRLSAPASRELKDMTSWPNYGPGATLEVLHSIDGLEVALTTYHDLWQQRSGVHSQNSCSESFIM